VLRTVEHFTGGASRLDELIDLLDRRRGVVLSSGTTVPGRYDSFDLGFADPPLVLETSGVDFSLVALNARGETLIAYLADVLREPCVVITEKTPARLSGHILRGDAPIEEDQRTRCSACSAPLPMTSCSRSRISCRSVRVTRTSATSCSTCRTGCLPMTAPPAAAWS
jgi:hypothetical protein